MEDNQIIQESRETIIGKVSEYLHWLTIPKKEFGNMPVCPYLNAELSKDLLYLKCMIFSPYEDFEVAGIKTRSGAPYFLINVAPTKQLGKSHRDLTKTKYFDNFTEDEKSRLNVPKK
jgi:hypothetical protein